jgi:L-asparaginase II
MEPPVAVEVWRGARVESRHSVHACVATPAGAVVHALGDVAAEVYPRSSLKPFQALALVESGAADAFGLGEAEIALACASHNGEPMHVERVERWLAALGLNVDALACGGQLPGHPPAAAALLRAGQEPRRSHDNCSGKHTGMLTVVRHLGLAVEGYTDPAHPLQARIAAGVAELAGLDALPAPGTDGCSAPIWPLPLRALATATARLAAPSHLAPARRAALERIAAAMRRHPELVAGTGRCCTLLMRELPEVTVKTGAEGVFIAALHGLGLGLALKVVDGATRAAEVALLACLGALGVLPTEPGETLRRLALPAILSRRGEVVGRIAPAPGWPRFAHA